MTFDFDKYVANTLSMNLDGFLQTLPKSITADAARLYGIDEADLEGRLAGLTVADNPMKNAKCRLRDDGRFEVIVYRGLGVFLWKLLALITSRCQFTRHEQVVEDISSTEQEVVTRFSRLLDEFWSTDFGYDEALLGWRLQEAQWDFCNDITKSALTFAVAHEFGHILLNAASTSTNILEAKKHGMAMAEMTLRDCPRTWSEGEFEKTVAHWGEEFAADVIGLRLNLHLVRDPRIWSYRFTGAQFFMISVLALEDYETRVGESLAFSGTHPLADFRLTVMRSIIRNPAPEMYQAGNTLESFVRRYLRMMGTSSDEPSEHFDNGADSSEDAGPWRSMKLGGVRFLSPCCQALLDNSVLKRPADQGSHKCPNCGADFTLVMMLEDDGSFGYFKV